MLGTKYQHQNIGAYSLHDWFLLTSEFTTFSSGLLSLHLIVRPHLSNVLVWCNQDIWCTPTHCHNWALECRLKCISLNTVELSSVTLNCRKSDWKWKQDLQSCTCSLYMQQRQMQVIWVTQNFLKKTLNLDLHFKTIGCLAWPFLPTHFHLIFISLQCKSGCDSIELVSGSILPHLSSNRGRSCECWARMQSINAGYQLRANPIFLNFQHFQHAIVPHYRMARPSV